MKTKYKKIIVYSDGGARGNPGPAGIGAVLYDAKGNELSKISEYIGQATNNQAEYKAMLAGMKKAKELGAEELICYLDSELVVKQMQREYRVKNKDLASLFVKAYNLSINFRSVKFVHIKREKNKFADGLANLAMDKEA